MFEVVKKALAVKVAAPAPELSTQEECARRAEELFCDQQQEIYRNTDELFARLMIVQWIASIVMAIVISPYTWAGQSHAIHVHVWAAIFLGGAISLFPIWLTRVWPGAAITRHVIAVAQMLMSALLISVTGGRIETHFHVFGSLVILSFYRDWRVLIPATIVVGLDHFLRGVYWPYSVYGVLAASPWRSVEHAAWVVFEDIFLVISCFRSIREMRSIANRTAALEASEQTFRQIFQDGPMGVALVDLQQRYVKVNESLCHMMGYSAEELIGKNTLDLTCPEDTHRDHEVVGSFRDGAARSSFDKRYIRKDGKVLWVNLTAAVIRDKNGQPQHYISMMKDITERKEALAALEASEENFRRIFEAAPVGVAVVDMDYNFLQVNPALCEMLGYSAAELLKLTSLDVTYPEDAAITKQNKAKILGGDSTISFEKRYVRKNGELIWVACKVSVIRSHDGSPPHILGTIQDISERKRAQEQIEELNESLEQRVRDRTAELLAAEERYRTLFDQNPEPMWVFDSETLGFLEVNQAAIEHYGYSRDEFLHMTLRDIRPQEDVPVLLNDLERLRPGETATGTWRHRKKDGNVIDVSITANEFVWNNRDARLVVAVDVTERKRADDALRSSEEKLGQAQRIAHLGYWERDLKTDSVYWSDETYRIFGLEPQESAVNFDRFQQVLHPEDRERVTQASAEAIKGGPRYDEGYRAIRPDGEVRFVHTQGDVVKDSSGRPVRMFGTVQDITEHKLTEDALRQAEHKYRAIFENAVEGIFQTTPDGHYISVNPALARMYGYASPEELMASVSDIGETIYVDPKRRDEFKRLIEANGSVDLFEYEVFRKDGKRIWLCENARTVRDDNGNILYYEGSVEDITERKLVDEVRRASKAKSEFLSRMSHELRTPLNAILGFAQLLDRQKPTEVQKKRISYILNAGKHLLDLINEVLDISRIEAGRMQLSLEPVCVADVLEETLDLMRPLATERTIKLSAAVDLDSSIYVLADRQRFKQVLLNLLNNAVKYTPHHGEVTVSYNLNGDGKVRVVVSDTGPGIPAEKLARLFVPFERLGAEQSAVEGTGLGLALSQRLTQAMGGSIDVESMVGKGSTFWIELPRTKSPLEQLPRQKENNGAQPSSLEPALRNILYIEDNLSNLALVEQVLAERPGTALLTTMQGKVGLDLARQHLPDLILLDLHLPDIPGWDVLTRLKSKEATRDIPVVVISADATKRQINRLMSAGATHYLTKPLDIAKFFDVLDKTGAASKARKKELTEVESTK